MHPAQDYAPRNGRREIDHAHTIMGGKVEWHIDGQGNSILRQISGDFEARYYHFNRQELTSDIIAALSVPGLIVEPGVRIGPCSNIGISKAGNGNDGSHVHLVIVCKEDKQTNLTPLLGEGWAENKMDKYFLDFGNAFQELAQSWRVRWMNDKVIYRFDPMTQKYAYYLNPKAILGW
jgi:hypothetical protein